MLDFLMNWGDKLRETFLEEDRYLMLLEGLGNTLVITAGALAIGLLIGALVALIRYAGEGVRWLRPLSRLCDLYVTVLRGVPVVVVLLIFYFALLPAAEGVTVAIITFGINSGAYMAELIRGGIGAVDPGQMEAARSLGMSRLQGTLLVVLPQAVKNILPAIGNEMIALLKETAVAGYVAVRDLTRAGNLIRNNTYDSFNPLMLVALTYLALVVALTAALGKMEQRLGRSAARNG